MHSGLTLSPKRNIDIALPTDRFQSICIRECLLKMLKSQMKVKLKTENKDLDHTEILTLNSALSISFFCTNSVLFVLFMTRAKLLFHRFLFKEEYFFLMKNCEF